MSPTERRLTAELAAHTRWATTTDRATATAPARRGLEAKWAKELDPDGTMPADQLAAALRNRRTAHMKLMALRSAQARRRGSAAA